MKTLNKITACCLAACVSVPFVASCGKKATKKDYSQVIAHVTVDNDSNLSGTLDIMAVDLGYGINMLEALELGFEKKYPNVEVNLKTNTLREKVTQENYLGPKHLRYDMFFTTDNTSVRKYLHNSPIAGYPIMFAELDDVYNTTPKGESKPIKDKMIDGYIEQYEHEDGHYYLMDWATGLGALYYNVDKFEANGYEVPVTSDDLALLCEEIKKDELKAFVVTETEYWHMQFYAFWAQYEGLDEYFNYHEGIDSSTGKISKNVVNQKGRLRALEAIEEYLDYGKGYTTEDSQNQTFMANQSDFFRGEALMYYSGTWLENEMSQLFPNGAKDELDIIPNLVSSAISEKMSYWADGTKDFYSLTASERASYDAKLKEAIAYVRGGKTGTQPSFINDTDIEYLEEVLSYRPLCNGHTVNIPAYAKDVDLAKAFLVFMYSDEGVEVYAKSGAPSLLPVKNSAIVVEGDTTAEKHTKEEYQKGFTAVYQISHTKLGYLGGFSALGEYVCLEAQFGKHHASDRMTAAEIFEALRVKYTNEDTWNDILKNAGLI